MTSSKEDILSEIRRAAAERGGRIGIAAFLRLTGIPESQILGKHWATWNEAMTEAGIETARFMVPRTADEVVLEALVQLVARLGRWPTERQLSLERRRDPSFPSLQVVRRLRREGDLKAKLLAHCAGGDGLVAVREVIAQLPVDESAMSRLAATRLQGFVYMMRSGKHYKIGRTNSPARRHREVRLDLPDRTDLVHSIETDDPAGIESYWHRRFASKRVRDTEFFTLNAQDVAAFKRREFQ